ncbi:MAG: type VII secretion integral membrane protein EccD [Mycobacterium sp.]|nr:type VII secretion integral membrane protein EccD [Mycobacterium sp.]
MRTSVVAVTADGSRITGIKPSVIQPSQQFDDGKEHGVSPQLTCGEPNTARAKAGYGNDHPTEGFTLPASDFGLRRVSVHAGAAVVDLALPATTPVGTLIPSIVDILRGHGVGDFDGVEPRRYRLAAPGASALDASTTLAQNGIRDGAILALTQCPPPPPAVRYDDVAEAVAATLKQTARPVNRFQHRLAAAVAATVLTGIGAAMLIRNAFRTNATGAAAGVTALAAVVALFFAAIAHRVCRDAIAGLASSLMAIEFASVAGFLAVPGPPGIPNVLLAATTATVVSIVAMRVSGCGAVTLTSVSCVAMIIAVAAFTGMVTAVPPYAIGSVAALLSLGLLGWAARASILLAGLSPRPVSPPDQAAAVDVPDRAITAQRWLTSLLAAFSSSAAVGAVITVLYGEPRLCCIAFGTVTGGLLLLRARSDDGTSDRTRMVVFFIGGFAVVATTFGVVALSVPERTAWIATVTAMLAIAAICVGFIAPAVSLSPVVRRGMEVLEWLVLVAMVPLTCWICGLYGAIRRLGLT